MKILSDSAFTVLRFARTPVKYYMHPIKAMMTVRIKTGEQNVCLSGVRQ